MAFIDDLPLEGDGCIKWPYSTNNQGYAQINVGGNKTGKKKLVSRLVCERIHGPAPSELHVAAHECGKGHEACIAPWHLTWKTPEQNRADMERHGTVRRGEDHIAKITRADVLFIRSNAGAISQSRLAERFGITQTAVSAIVRRRNWKHVA